MMNNGALVISLDFELLWGVHDLVTPEGYGVSNVLNVHKALPLIVDLFEKYSVHATVATVGLIFCKNKEQAMRKKPALLPTYNNADLCSYKNGYIEGIKDCYKDMYFAPQLIRKLFQSRCIEIGSHTFSHYYCWEKGQTIEQFEADLLQMKSIADEFQIDINSIVFPRNMVDETYLSICTKYGIRTYRGNALQYFNNTKSKLVEIKNKVCRVLDAYLNIGGYTSYHIDSINKQESPVNIPASRFLRPFNPILKALEGLRLERIQKELMYAAKNNEVYHLWWHPHNFGNNMQENLSFLEEILKCYKMCHEQYGMQSYSMTEFVDTIK